MGRVSSSKCLCPKQYKELGNKCFVLKPWRNCVSSKICSAPWCAKYYCTYYVKDGIHCHLQTYPRPDYENIKTRNKQIKLTQYEKNERRDIKKLIRKTENKGYYKEKYLEVICSTPEITYKQHSKNFMKQCLLLHNKTNITNEEKAKNQLKNEKINRKNCNSIMDWKRNYESQ